MLVRSWMRADPVTVSSAMLVSEAEQVLAQGNLHAIPVVDDDRLRGLVTRANLLRTAHFVLSTQSADELDFFAKRLKVRDIMLRNPATVQADDTMEHCLLRGRALGVAQFPVLDGVRVVGMISANEIFELAAHCLGAWERRSGVTLAAVEIAPGVLGRIADAVDRAGAVLQALYPVSRHNPNAGGAYQSKKVIVRFQGKPVSVVIEALEAGGFEIIDSVEPTSHGAAEALT